MELHKSCVEPQSEYKSGLDLFRIVTMMLVIGMHILGHGSLRVSVQPDTVNYYLVYFLQFLVYPNVNCFVLLSGYLLCDRQVKLSRILKLWAAAVFWSVVIQCVFFAAGTEPVTLGRVVYMFLPLLNGRYWFFNAYFIMMLASPILNHFINALDKRSIQALLLALLTAFSVMPLLAFGNDIFGVQNGYNFSWFCVLYLFGGYLKRFGTTRRHRSIFWLCGYFLLAAAQLLLMVAMGKWFVGLVGENAFQNMFLKYTSPFVFAAAACLFLCFYELPLKTSSQAARWAKIISPLVFSVYLIHDHPLVRRYFIQDRFSDWAFLPPLQLLLQYIITSLVIFLTCIFADALRSWLFQRLKVEHLCTKAGDNITKTIYKLLSGI